MSNTAMQELIEFINDNQKDFLDAEIAIFSIRGKAKLLLEKEKQQIIDAYKAGNDSTCMEHEDIEAYFNNYYNQKYKQ